MQSNLYTPFNIENNTHLKSYLLDNHKSTFYKQLKPQMGGFISEESIGISILKSELNENQLNIKCAVFYEEKIGGCNCLDDPHSENGYCEMSFSLNNSGELIFK